MVSKKEKKEPLYQTQVIDIQDKRNVIIRFKDLIDIGPMLQMDSGAVMGTFIKQLKEAGWGGNMIQEMVQIAASKSMFLQNLPHMQKESGSWFEYLLDRSRRR